MSEAVLLILLMFFNVHLCILFALTFGPASPSTFNPKTATTVLSTTCRPKITQHEKKSCLLKESLYSLEDQETNFSKSAKPNENFARDTCISTLSTLIMLYCIHLGVRYSVEDAAYLGKISRIATGFGAFFLDAVFIILSLDRITAHQSLWYTVPTFSHFFLLVSLTILCIFLISKIVSEDNSKKRHFRKFDEQLGHGKKFSLFCLFLFTVVLVWWKFSAFRQTFPLSTKGQGDDLCWLTMREPHLILYTVPNFAVFNFFPYLVLSVEGLIEYLETRTVPLAAKEHLEQDFYYSCKMYLILLLTWSVGALGTLFELAWLHWIFAFLHIVESMYFVIYAFKETVGLSRDAWFEALTGYHKEDFQRNEQRTLNDENPILYIIREDE